MKLRVQGVTELRRTNSVEDSVIPAQSLNQKSDMARRSDCFGNVSLGVKSVSVNPDLRRVSAFGEKGGRLVIPEILLTA